MNVYEYRYTRHKVAEVLGPIKTPFEIAELMVKLLPSTLETEYLITVCLDTKNNVIGHDVVYKGNVAGSPARIGECYRMAVRTNAAAVIIGHNHPSGDPAPSGEDLRITAEFISGGKLLDIELLDHIIVGDNRWTSMRALGAMMPG